MENMQEHVEYLVFKHTEMLQNDEYNTVQFGDLEHELMSFWNMSPDEYGFYHYDQPEGYIVRPILHDDETTARVVQHETTKVALGAYSTQEEALEVVKKEKEKKEEMNRKVKELSKKFDKQVKKNSLNERYKDKVVEKKPKAKKETYVSKYLGRLRQRTEELHAEFEQMRSDRNWKLGNVEYIDALINH